MNLFQNILMIIKNIKMQNLQIYYFQVNLLLK